VCQISHVLFVVALVQYNPGAWPLNAATGQVAAFNLTQTVPVPVHYLSSSFYSITNAESTALQGYATAPLAVNNQPLFFSDDTDVDGISLKQASCFSSCLTIMNNFCVVHLFQLFSADLCLLLSVLCVLCVCRIRSHGDCDILE
jgi:hypothetical protein